MSLRGRLKASRNNFNRPILPESQKADIESPGGWLAGGHLMSNAGDGMAAQDFVALPTMLFTHDEARVGHIISEETLMQLAHAGHDRSLEIAIGALGVAAGFFQNFANVIALLWASQALPRWDALGALFFVVSVTTAITFLLSFRRNNSQTVDLITQIKSRKVGRIVEPGRPYVEGEPVAPVTSVDQASASTTD